MIKLTSEDIAEFTKLYLEVTGIKLNENEASQNAYKLILCILRLIKDYEYR